MPIDITGPSNSQSHGANSAQGQNGQKSQTAAQQETGKPSATDTVSLTEAAAQLKNLEQDVAAAPIVDSQRVEALKSAITNGNFEADSIKVAEKLMAFETALFK